MDKSKPDIHKAAGILIKNRKLLVCKEFSYDYFVAPGGKVDEGETPTQALIRELKEELNIIVNENDLEKFGKFYAQAAGDFNKSLQMDTCLIKNWQGKIKSGNEIKEILWVNSQIPPDIKVGSIFQHEVIPRLKKMDLID